MKIHEATEQAYKNGYEKGKRDAVKPNGRWKCAGLGDYYCSLCCFVVSGSNYHYCPHCGANMMDGGNDDV